LAIVTHRGPSARVDAEETSYASIGGDRNIEDLLLREALGEGGTGLSKRLLNVDLPWAFDDEPDRDVRTLVLSCGAAGIASGARNPTVCKGDVTHIRHTTYI